MPVNSFDELTRELRACALRSAAKKTVALVGANDEHALEAVLAARDIMDAVLVGERTSIEETLLALGSRRDAFEIVEPKAQEHPSVAAAKLIHSGRADFLMKGKLMTGDLLKGVLLPEADLRKGSLMSHIAIFELPNYHKLLCVTDGGMCVEPELSEKAQIVRNAVDFFHGLGYNKPNIAALCAAEAVSPKIKETVDAEALALMAGSGELGSCHLEGPISYDLAMDREAGQVKGYHSEAAGEFDILLVPNLVSGNILGKCFICNCGALMAGLILGAKMPIVLTSRGASAAEKLNSLALAAALRAAD